ncbi:YheU family protein [Parashewanella tropica]|uniref:YheU family protein n=1 Tax=Parashewanella tropica TaxID=2547970 RepID=UPI00105A7E36|nr:YheU family protein [Parashewanella tropica]
MLIPYQSLLSLPTETLDNLIKEHLFTQVEDGGFENTGEQQLSQAISQCRQQLKQGLLVVEYSEDDETFAIRHKDQIQTIG